MRSIGKWRHLPRLTLHSTVRYVVKGVARWLLSMCLAVLRATLEDDFIFYVPPSSSTCQWVHFCVCLFSPREGGFFVWNRVVCLCQSSASTESIMYCNAVGRECSLLLLLHTQAGIHEQKCVCMLVNVRTCVCVRVRWWLLLLSLLEK